MSILYLSHIHTARCEPCLIIVIIYVHCRTCIDIHEMVRLSHRRTHIIYLYIYILVALGVPNIHDRRAAEQHNIFVIMLQTLSVQSF